MLSDSAVSITGSCEENCLKVSASNSKWFVFYTTPRAEKIAYQEIIKRGYEVFLPMVKTLRLWRNRQKKMIDQVLFPSYIFVKSSEPELYRITQVPKIVTCICSGGKPSIIPLKDIESIKKMLSLDQSIFIENKFLEGDKVRVLSGPMIGYEGVLVKQKNRTRFGIQFKEINHTVLIDICCSMLQKSEIYK